MSDQETKPTGSAQTGGEQPEKQIKIENLNNEQVKPTQEPNPTIDLGSFDRIADAARDQANRAVEAFQRGDFIENASLDSAANADDRLVAALSYWVPGLISLLVIYSDSGKNRPFQRYHARQALGVTIASILFLVGYTVVSTVVSLIPLLGWVIGALLWCFSPLAMLMPMIALAYYGYQAFQGKNFAIPGLTSYLREQKWL